jgi:uncharacterized protein DUF4058
MPPVRSVKNQYVGINAHLHSYFQREGGWDGFHANHIADLMRLMSAQLLPMGYVADLQESLQIRRLGEPAERYAPVANLPQTVEAVAIPDIMSDEQEISPYNAIGIYEYSVSERSPGQPVAWVELLSPSNKPGGQDALYYLRKRWKLLHSGLVFVELDYLQEYPPTFDKLPRYQRTRSESHPYHIVVVDPRPAFSEGTAYPYHFDVDQPIPTVAIPLNGTDVLNFDFRAAYSKSFRETLYGARFVDYSQLPLDFDHYSEADQARIVSRMVAVLKVARAGENLEADEPFPVEPYSLPDGLAELEHWKAEN